MNLILIQNVFIYLYLFLGCFATIRLQEGVAFVLFKKQLNRFFVRSLFLPLLSRCILL